MRFGVAKATRRDIWEIARWSDLSPLSGGRFGQPVVTALIFFGLQRGLIALLASPHAKYGSLASIYHAGTTQDQSRAAPDVGRGRPQHAAERGPRREAPAEGQKRSWLGRACSVN